MSLYFAEFCRLLICVVMGVGALAKCLTLRAFKASLRESGLLTPAVVAPAAVGVIACEALTATLLLSDGRSRQVGYGLALALLCMFTLYLGLALWRETGASCNCFGDRDEPISGYDIGRNAALMAVVGVAWCSNTASASVEPAVLALLAALAVAVFLALINLATIVFVLRYRGPDGKQ